MEPLSYQFVNESQLMPNMAALVSQGVVGGAQHQLQGAMPMSYSLSTGLSGGYDTAALLASGGQPMATGYVINGQTGHPMQYGTLGSVVHQQQQQQQQSMMGSPYSPYGTLPYGNQAAAAYSTLQHPRRVRVIPPTSSMSTPPPLGSPATTLSLTSSGSTSLATNVHRTSNDQLSRSPMTDV